MDVKFFCYSVESMDAPQWNHFKQRELDVQALCHLIKWGVSSCSKAWEDRMPYLAEMLAQNFQAIPLLFN